MRKRNPSYHSWWHAKDRCTNPKNKRWARYGGRGISMCDEWLNSFDNFLADMGVRPDGLTLERVDNDLGYSPDNCVWATHKQQAQNQCGSKLTLEDVVKIRELLAKGLSHRKIAALFGVSSPTITGINTGKYW